MDEKFLRNVDEAPGNWLGEDVQEPPRFGGKPGEPVPAVDPEDVRLFGKLEGTLKSVIPVGRSRSV
jgi:hypothetical protein